MKKTYTSRRCSQCSEFFIPDPRVGARQVTCGSKPCQRSRHADRCRVWHVRNPVSAAHHYVDVVVPYRAEHPSYQRRWRAWQRLHEIREEMLRVLLGAGERLAAVLIRGRKAQRLAAQEPAQAASVVGDRLSSALHAGEGIVGLLAKLTGLLAGLEYLGAAR